MEVIPEWLDSRVRQLNQELGRNPDRHTKDGDKLNVNVGNLHLDSNSTGLIVEEIVNANGETSCPFGYVRRTETEMMYFLCALIAAVKMAKQQTK